MIKAVIFDVDGVLIDSIDQIVDDFQEVGKILGLKIPKRNFIKKRIGLPSSKVIEDCYGKNRKANNLFIKLALKRRPKLRSGVRTVLRKIRLTKAIVTTMRRAVAKKQLKNILKYFKVTVMFEDTKEYKPSPLPLLLACKKLGIYWDEAIYVGDMVRDYETAKNANMEFVGVLGGASTKSEFKRAKVRYLIKSLEELPKVLKKIIIRPRVVTCFLKYKDKILLLKRSSHMKYYRNKWNGVSGYIKPLENPDTRARKEIFEETKIKKTKLIRKGKVIQVFDENQKILWIVHPYLFRIYTDKIKIDWEHTEYKWIKPNEIKKYDTTPKLYETLKKVI
jgi:HAD superfamily hydrolase (TIGR01509 family)